MFQWARALILTRKEVHVRGFPPPWWAADRDPSVPNPPTVVEPTWEAATPFRAVVGAGGAEILWLVVWQSISQSLSHAVVRDVKQG